MDGLDRGGGHDGDFRNCAGAGVLLQVPDPAELEQRGLGLEDWWQDAADWMPGGVKADTVSNWKVGKLQ